VLRDPVVSIGELELHICIRMQSVASILVVKGLIKSDNLALQEPRVTIKTKTAVK